MFFFLWSMHSILEVKTWAISAFLNLAYAFGILVLSNIVKVHDMFIKDTC